MDDLRKFYIEVKSEWKPVRLKLIRKDQIFRVDDKEDEYIARGDAYINDYGTWTILCEILPEN